METLELNFLGDIEVIRNGEVQPLPPSRKTRALLAYLALQPRKFRREHLCELLWEVPDDPRGSLRWSLSKLRRIVDDADCRRVVADRTHVSFEPASVRVDVSALKDLVEQGLDKASTETLEQAAKRYGGHFLEGLELSNFHEFHAWCIAERELYTQAQSELLTELVRRKQADPAEALPFARELVSIAPYSESARETLIRILVALDRPAEARQQYELGSRMLKEIGAQPTGALSRALSASGNSSSTDRQTGGSARPPQPGGEADANGNRSTRATDAEIVGRETELARIRGLIDAPRDDSAQKLILIRGEPGIGKSRLLKAATEHAQMTGAMVLESSAFESESIRPFAIWIDAVRRINPNAAKAIFAAREGENREKLLGALSDLISEMSNSQPVVLVFDDLQWCDDSSATALHYITRTNRQHPVIGVLAAREVELKDNAGLQQALNGLRHAGLLSETCIEPLSEDDLQRLIEMQAPGADSSSLARQCGGNPLMAIELARAELTGDSGRSLTEVLRERLGRFDVESAEVLRWAAVLAPRIDVALLEKLTDLSSAVVASALALAERQGMLQPAVRGYSFSHDLVARGVYNDISPARRRMMHRRIAEELEKESAVELEHAADVAHHASQSGDAGLAARAMVSAAKLCLRFYANDEAISLANRGLNLLDKLPEGERVCLTIDLKDIMLIASPLADWEAAVDELNALAEKALDHGEMSHARRGYYMASYIRWKQGQWSGARDEVLQSERVARGGTDEDHIVGMAEAARCLALLERDLTHADAMLMEAQALAERKRLSHHSIPAALGMLRYHKSEFDLARALFEEARTLAKRAGDRISEFQTNEHLVMLDIDGGDYQAARKRCKALVEIGDKLQIGSEGPFARALEAVCVYAIDDTKDSLDSVIERLRSVDAKHRLAYALTRVAIVDFERGRHEDALARASEALENASILDRATDMLLAHTVLARVNRAIGDQKQFAHHAARIEEFDRDRVAEWARLQAEEALA
jgi:DNA-binding SARP family transcriptional activator/predicted ATPase